MISRLWQIHVVSMTHKSSVCRPLCGDAFPNANIFTSVLHNFRRWSTRQIQFCGRESYGFRRFGFCFSGFFLPFGGFVVPAQKSVTGASASFRRFIRSVFSQFLPKNSNCNRFGNSVNFSTRGPPVNFLIVNGSIDAFYAMITHRMTNAYRRVVVWFVSRVLCRHKNWLLTRSLTT